MKLGTLVLVLATALIGISAQAEKKASLHDQFSGQGYGTAGCGLGSVVFGQKPGIIQVIAATTNAVGYQTLAISSGTSNCGEAQTQARADQFIDVNKVALENDLARGAGESMTSLAQVMGCKNSNFSLEMKSRYTPGLSKDQLSTAAVKSCQI